LYEESINVLMYRRNVAIGYPVEEFRRMMPNPHFILGELAYGLHKDSEMQGSGIAEPPREEIKGRLAKIIIERRKVVDDDKIDAIRSREVPEFCRFIEERTSILVGRGMGRYGFVHQTFQEYFAAYYLNTIWDMEKIWSEIKSKIWNQYWWEVLLLLSEMLARRGDVLDILLEKIIKETEELKGVPSPLLFLADIVIQGTPVTDFFKSRILKPLYETCLAYGEVSGSFADRLGKLGDHGLNEETYNLLEKDIGGTSGERRHWAIRYFAVRNDLIETCVERFERVVEPYIEDKRVRELLLPLLGDLKRLTAPILRSTDIELMIKPWYLPPVLPFYYRYLMESERFAEPSYVLKKLSAGMFVYSSNLAFLTLALDLDPDLAWARIRAQARALTLAQALALAQALVRTQAQTQARALDLVLTLAQAQDQTRTITAMIAIDDETIFHGAMIHMAALLEFVSVREEELPSHLAYALEKQPDPLSPYVRAAQLFRRFIRREITPGEELEFQRLLNIEDKEIRHIFDLAYLTDSETRDPIFRFRTKLEST